MAIRLVLTDAVWAKIDPALRTIKHYAGSPPRLSDRMFIEVVLYQARTGIPWRDFPDDFGHWDAVYNRFRRWEARDLWKKLWQHMHQHGCKLATQILIDSTIMRAHQHAAGAPKKTVVKTPRLWAVLGAAFPPNCMPPAQTKRQVSACL
jgi:putative transposase